MLLFQKEMGDWALQNFALEMYFFIYAILKKVCVDLVRGLNLQYFEDF